MGKLECPHCEVPFNTGQEQAVDPLDLLNKPPGELYAWKKQIPTSYIIYDSIYVTPRKDKTMEM